LLENIEGIGTARAKSIKSFSNFGRVEQEVSFLEKYKIQPICLTDKKYPRRLLHCYDSPTMLYFRGSANLNAPIILAIIGTRSNSEYGKSSIEKIITELVSFQPVIVSGLAFGIDALAHKLSLKYKLATIGVLAHGLHTIYPPEHTQLAKDMLQQGGILTEFRSNVKPDKHNFPIRNRIVAGMADATLVIETGIRGGSMITAELANGYNKDVFAIPGKIGDGKSAGCNDLIKNNKAILLTDSQQLIETMGWERKNEDHTKKIIQRELFLELSSLEKTIVSIISQHETIHIDELHLHSKASASSTAAAILNLELQGLIISIPGKRFSLADHS
jgi:DNA processing protein